MYENLCYFIFPLFAFIYWFFTYVKDKQKFWVHRGLGGPTPVWGIGNLYERLFNELHELEIKWMRKYGKLYGIQMGTVPALWVADHEVIKQVLIKDFQYFVNRAQSPAYHELWDQNMLFAKDEQWRRVRAIASPTFSSGKLKSMYSIMNVCIGKLEKHLNQLVAKENGLMDAKNVIQSFTMDVIAMTNFASDLDTYNEQNDTLKFGKRLFDVNASRMLALVFLPRFMLDLLDIKTFIDPETLNYFIKFTKHIVKDRKANAGKFQGQNDLLQLLIEASIDENVLNETNYDNLEIGEELDETTTAAKTTSTTTRKKLTDSEIVANCIFFIVAGFETTASTITHCIFELVQNPEIQDQLHQEVTTAVENLDQNSNDYFEVINSGIPFLEAVIKETLRKYPPVTLLTRVCTKEDYRIRGIQIGKIMVGISVSAVHYCEDYYPEPEKFNPERFMPENKHLLVPYTYLPFGAGPRNCVGMRFAYQEMRLCLATIVQKFKFEATPDTPTKLSFKKGNSLLNTLPFSVKVSSRI